MPLNVWGRTGCMKHTVEWGWGWRRGIGDMLRTGDKDEEQFPISSCLSWLANGGLVISLDPTQKALMKESARFSVQKGSKG